ncbi:MAG: phosphomethylpyrimidine kinase [Methanomicrobiales archaeon]|nr:phosphomethylpyrimidine kinase [Methanomicrobiales archaeon]
MHEKEPGADRTVALTRLSAALHSLEEITLSPALVPKEGIELACALSHAMLPEAVATVVFVPRNPGRPVFGIANEAVRSLLTARRFDPQIHATGVIRHSGAIETVLDELFLQVCAYDRTREPPGITSMHWGVASCCRDGVPDAVIDRGGRGAEGLVRLFAEDPAGVARTISAISRRLDAEEQKGI